MRQPSKQYLAYMLVVGVVGYGVLAWLTALRWRQGVSVSLIWEAGFFLALATLVGMNPRFLPGRGRATTTVGFAVDYACLLIFGPGVAAWIGVVSFLVLLWRSHWLRQFFNHGQLALSFAAAGWAYELLGGRYVDPAHPVRFSQMGLALVGAGVAYVVTGSLLISTAIALWERASVLGTWAVSYRWVAPRYLALAPFGLLMAMVYQVPGLGILAVALFLAPLVGARYAFQGAMETLEVHRGTVFALTTALGGYDAYTKQHSEDVTRYALLIGREIGLSEPRLEVLEWAGRTHDLGKARPDWEPIFRKPGKPSAREWEVIRQHPVEGSRLVRNVESLPHTQGKVAGIVLAHHERLDGSGYPDGRRADAIPFEARILAVADAYEAMTAPRAYHRQRSPEEAVAELRRCADTQFDPRVVEGAAKLVARGELQPGGAATEEPAVAWAELDTSSIAPFPARRAGRRSHQMTHGRLWLLSLYVGGVIAAGVVGLVWAMGQWQGVSLGVWGVVFFIGLAAVLDLMVVPVGEGGGTAASFAVFFAGLLVLGPGPTACVAALAAAWSEGMVRRSPPVRAGFNAAHSVLSLLAAGWVYQVLGGRVGRMEVRAALAAAVGAAVVLWLLETGWVALAVALERGGRMWRRLCASLGPMLALDGALASVGLLLALLYQSRRELIGEAGLAGEVSLGGGLLLAGVTLVPSGLLYYAYRLQRQLGEAYSQSVQALGALMEAKVEGSQPGHGEKVGKLAVELAQALELPGRQVEQVRYAGYLHDLGKVAVPAELLARGRDLFSGDPPALRLHPELGAQILGPVPFLRPAAQMVWTHHERWDGLGYPHGLRGEQIPLGARLLAVADAYLGAIASLRPEQALARLRHAAGSRFDPQAVEALAAHVGATGAPPVTLPSEASPGPASWR